MGARRPNAEERAKIFKALADPRRVDIVDALLRGEPMCGTALAEALGVSLALACHHWEVLVDAGVLKKERVGQLRVCSVDVERIREAFGEWGLAAPAPPRDAEPTPPRDAEPTPARGAEPPPGPDARPPCAGAEPPPAPGAEPAPARGARPPPAGAEPPPARAAAAPTRAGALPKAAPTRPSPKPGAAGRAAPKGAPPRRPARPAAGAGAAAAKTRGQSARRR